MNELRKLVQSKTELLLLLEQRMSGLNAEQGKCREQMQQVDAELVPLRSELSKLESVLIHAEPGKMAPEPKTDSVP